MEWSSAKIPPDCQQLHDRQPPVAPMWGLGKKPRHTGEEVTRILRSEKLQNERFPNFSIFRPEFCLEFCSEFPPNFLRSFHASFCGRRRPEKFTKNPRHFSMQNSQADSKKKFTKCFWRAVKVNNTGSVSLVLGSGVVLHLPNQILQISNQISPKNFIASFCRHGNPKSFARCARVQHL